MPNLPLDYQPTVARIAKFMLIDKSQVTYRLIKTLEAYEFKYNGYKFQIACYPLRKRYCFSVHRLITTDKGSVKLGECSIPNYKGGKEVAASDVELAIKECCGHVRAEVVRLAQQ